MLVLIPVLGGVSGRKLMPRIWDSWTFFFLACLKLFLLCFIMKVVTFENYFCCSSLGLGVKELMVSRVRYCSEL